MTTYRIPLLHRLDRYPRNARTFQLARRVSDPPTRERKKTRSAPGVILSRLLAVLVVAMVVTSIAGLTVFGDHSNVGAGVIGMFAAVLGLIYGFLTAYQPR